MDGVVHRVESGTVEHDLEDPARRMLEAKVGELVVALVHRMLLRLWQT
jgi:hypothetical protein